MEPTHWRVFASTAVHRAPGVRAALLNPRSSASRTWNALRAASAYASRRPLLSVIALAVIAGSIVLTWHLWEPPAGLFLFFGVALSVAALAAGAYLWMPSRGERGGRSELGSAVIGGAVVALALLLLEIYGDHRLGERLARQEKVFEERLARQEEAFERELARQQIRQQTILQLGLARDLTGIDLSGRQLRAVYLRGKTLNGAVFHNSDLTRANLARASLVGARLTDTTLVCANLNQAHLHDARLMQSKLRGARLIGAIAPDAKFYGADLTGADLTGANLRDAKFVGATLTDADLSGADLAGADLRGARLDGVGIDKETTWPDGTPRPPAGRASVKSCRD